MQTIAPREAVGSGGLLSQGVLVGACSMLSRQVFGLMRSVKMLGFRIFGEAKCIIGARSRCTSRGIRGMNRREVLIRGTLERSTLVRVRAFSYGAEDHLYVVNA